jgi:RNA polymerase sigma-70 factor (ECF subfamily)
MSGASWRKGWFGFPIQPLRPDATLIGVNVDDDRRLVEAYVTERDEASFLALYRAHTPALYRMAWRLGGQSPEDADEIIQDVWVRAAAKLATFRFESALRTWLVSILIRRVSEHRRRPALTLASVNAPEPAVRMTPALSIDLERSIAALPAGMREVFVLHDIEGLTHEDIGACLGIAEGTSKSQLFQARERLRRWLGRTGHGA